MTGNSSGYSAHVELVLVLNGRQLELGQVGPEHCTIRHPEEIPPSQAEIVMRVDGEETRISVFLPDGISAGNRRIPYAQLSTAIPPMVQSFVSHQS